jgi:hypothetical protein
LVAQLLSATETANDEVYRRFSGRSGATLSAIGASSNGEVACVNVGDSRVYGFLANGKVKQISKDDSLGNILSDMELDFPPSHFRELLQYVGMGKGIQAHGIPIREADTYNCLFLTSDGAHELDCELFEQVVLNAGSSKEIARRLTTLSDWKGGKDNATVAVWSIHKTEPRQADPSHRGFLEVWGLSGKFEITSRQKTFPLAFQAEKTEPVRQIRRRSNLGKEIEKQPSNKVNSSINTPTGSSSPVIQARRNVMPQTIDSAGNDKDVNLQIELSDI